MEDNKKEKKEKEIEEEIQTKSKHIKTIKGKGLTAFIIIIVVIAIALSYGCGFILGKQLYENKNEEQEQGESAEEPKGDEPISEDEIKNQMNNKFEKISTNVNYGIFDIEEYSDLRKLVLVLDKLQFEKVKEDSANGTTTSKLLEETINGEYYSVFGENPKKFSEVGSLRYCATYKYNESEKTYVKEATGCDIGWGWNAYNYIYNYEFDSNKAYMYVSVGVMEGICDLDGAKVLSDKDVVYEEIPSNGNCNFELNESNYQKFAKYKLTFEKIDDQYYFKNIEKIENGTTK